MLVAGTFFGFGWSAPEEAHAAAGDTVESSSIAAGDIIYYGNYPQVKMEAAPNGAPQSPSAGDVYTDNNSVKYEYAGSNWYKYEPIAWRVLQNASEKLFLLSEKAIDAKAYNRDDESITWETCTARSWLNGYDASENTDSENYSVAGTNFITKAFTSNEQTKIATTEDMGNPANPNYPTIPGGNNTTDKIFYLKHQDVTGAEAIYFTTNASRIAVATEYIIAMGASVSSGKTDWWLRSPGDQATTAEHVGNAGSLYARYVYYANVAVRPAFYLETPGVIFRKTETGGYNTYLDLKTLTATGTDASALSPSFNTDTTEYNVTVPYSTDSITLGATADSLNATSQTTIDGTGEEDLDVGENEFPIELKDSDGDVLKTYTVTVTREKGIASASTTPVAKTLTYTGEAQDLVTAGSGTNGTMQYKLDDGDYSTDIPTATAVGDYTVKYKVVATDTENYEDSAEVTLDTITIGKADNTTLSVSQADITYGTEVDSEVTGAKGTVTVRYKLNAANDDAYKTDKPTAAGTYTVQAVDAGTANYNAKTVTDDFTISKAGQATALAIENGEDEITELTKQYGDANVSLTAEGGDGTGAYSWISSNTGVASITGTGTGTLVIGDVGTATITLTKAADNNYTVKTTTLSVTVSKRDVTISYVKDVEKTDTKVYDGNANATSALKGTYTVNNTKAGDNSLAIDVNSASASATFENADADTGKTVTFAGFSLSGSKASSSYNLTGQPGSTTADITKAAPTYTAPTAETGLNYTGNAQDLIATEGSTEHGTITYKVGTGGTYSETVPKETNAGDYEVYWKLTGDDNHTDIEETKLATVSIGKADNTTLSVTQDDITYGTTVNPEVTGANGTVTVRYKLKAADDETYTTDKPTNAGEYTVQASDAGTANYNAKTATDDFTINKATVSTKAIAGVTAPAAGATPKSAITGTAQYTGAVSWTPEVSGTFAYGTAYTATITLTPKSNYTLDGVEENSFTVAGADAENEAGSGVITAVFPATGTQPADADITPDSADFDLYKSDANHTDIAVTLNPGAHEFIALKNGNQTLTVTTDYTVNEDVYTIKASYLEKLSVGAHALTFDMDGGTDPALSISVTDSTPELSDDATLKSLSVTAGGAELLTGENEFSADKIGYNLSVPNDVSLVTLTAEAKHAGATIAEGNLGEKNLTVIGGAGNVFKITVTAEDEVAKKTYTVTVTREAAELSANADLKSLSVSGAALNPAFNAGTINYSANVPNAIAQITISATSADANAAVTGAGAKALNVGANKFDIKVTAENGSVKTYTVTVTRAASIPVVKPVYPKVTSIKTPMTKMSIVVKKGKLNLKNLVGLYTTGNKPIKDPKLTWTSSKPKIATVSKTGAVKAGKKTGKTVITVKAQNGKKLKITITVVKKAKKLKKLTGKVPKLKKGKPAFITLKGTGTNITKIKWKVKGKGLKIDKFGMATATKKGKFTITATAGGKKFTKKVTVK
jgi:methionine-rich copper-binding protein CopC